MRSGRTRRNHRSKLTHLSYQKNDQQIHPRRGGLVDEINSVAREGGSEGMRKVVRLDWLSGGGERLNHPVQKLWKLSPPLEFSEIRSDGWVDSHYLGVEQIPRPGDPHPLAN